MAQPEPETTPDPAREVTLDVQDSLIGQDASAEPPMVEREDADAEAGP